MFPEFLGVVMLVVLVVGVLHLGRLGKTTIGQVVILIILNHGVSFGILFVNLILSDFHQRVDPMFHPGVDLFILH